MERLTQRANGFIQLIGTGTKISESCNLPILKGTMKLADYEDTGLTPEEISALVTINGNLVRTNDKLNTRLSEYSQAEEQGLLHIAPLQDGTPIFFETCIDEEFEECGITDKISQSTYLHGVSEYDFGEFNKTFFITRAEAEEALKGSTLNG